MNPSEIQDRIERALPGSRVEVRDTTGGGDHFEALVVSPAFEAMTVIEQHRLVYAALGEQVGREIHALALRTFDPQQWDARSREERT